MAQLVVRNLPDEVKELLKLRARRHGRSLEAEVRKLLVDASRKETWTDDDAAPDPKKGFGTLMQEVFGPRGLTDAEHRQFERAIAEFNSRSTLRIPDFEE